MRLMQNCWLQISNILIGIVENFYLFQSVQSEWSFSTLSPLVLVLPSFLVHSLSVIQFSVFLAKSSFNLILISMQTFQFLFLTLLVPLLSWFYNILQLLPNLPYFFGFTCFYLQVSIVFNDILLWFSVIP